MLLLYHLARGGSDFGYRRQIIGGLDRFAVDSPNLITLQEGDQILAIDGKPIQTSYDLLSELQTRRVLMIVQRDPLATDKILWTQADAQFDQFGLSDLNEIVTHLGTETPVVSSGHL